MLLTYLLRADLSASTRVDSCKKRNKKYDMEAILKLKDYSEVKVNQNKHFLSDICGNKIMLFYTLKGWRSRAEEAPELLKD